MSSSQLTISYFSEGVGIPPTRCLTIVYTVDGFLETNLCWYFHMGMGQNGQATEEFTIWLGKSPSSSQLDPWPGWWILKSAKLWLWQAIAMEAMVHRNRWFTELKNGGSFHGKLLDNQMLMFLKQCHKPTQKWSPLLLFVHSSAICPKWSRQPLPVSLWFMVANNELVTGAFMLTNKHNWGWVTLYIFRLFPYKHI